ncbi:MAG: lytic transglycosylase domain-containing protein, partial [Desulfobacterales bacterium]|nr:lytic transglycosylase domain-containing protein [Desulfobacterales bacterium]
MECPSTKTLSVEEHDAAIEPMTNPQGRSRREIPTQRPIPVMAMISILGKKRCAIFTTLLLLIGSLPAAADIYMYRDRHGVLHFTNAPAKPGYHLFLSTRKPNVGSRTPTDRFDQFITDAARTHGLDIPLLKAIIKVESDFNPQAVSRAGAQGLMQIMPETADLLEIKEPFDPWENIMGGTRYLKTLLE